jgi:hypothetical protein
MAGELNSNIRDRCCPEVHRAFTACLVVNLIFSFFRTKSFGWFAKKNHLGEFISHASRAERRRLSEEAGCDPTI